MSSYFYINKPFNEEKLKGLNLKTYREPNYNSLIVEYNNLYCELEEDHNKDIFSLCFRLYSDFEIINSLKNNNIQEYDIFKLLYDCRKYIFTELRKLDILFMNEDNHVLYELLIENNIEFDKNLYWNESNKSCYILNYDKLTPELYKSSYINDLYNNYSHLFNLEETND